MSKDKKIFDLEEHLIVRANLLKSKSKLEPDIHENDELISIFMASIKTAKQNKRKPS
jgi:hypothetical protein